MKLLSTDKRATAILSVHEHESPGLDPVQIAADAVEINDTGVADLGGGDGLGLDPATHHAFGDLFQAQHLGEDGLGAERSGTKIRDFLSSSGEP